MLFSGPAGSNRTTASATGINDHEFPTLYCIESSPVTPSVGDRLLTLVKKYCIIMIPSTSYQIDYL